MPLALGFCRRLRHLLNGVDKLVSPQSNGLTQPETMAKARHASDMTLSGTVVWQRYSSDPTPSLSFLLDNDPDSAAAAKADGAPAAAAKGGVGNRIEGRFAGDWAAQLSFVCRGDVVTIKAFDVHERHSTSAPTSAVTPPPELAKGIPFAIAPNAHSAVEVRRQQKVVLTATDVAHAGGVPPLVGAMRDLRQREYDVKHASDTTEEPPHPLINSFANCHRYYDAIHGARATFDPVGQFLERMAASRRAILDAGCGTGLVAFFLAHCGLPPVCVDHSPTAQSIILEKNRWFGHGSPDETADASASDGAVVPLAPSGMTPPVRRASGVRFFLGNIADPAWTLTSVDEAGRDRPSSFDLVLCLDTVAYLPSLSAMRTALLNLTKQAAQAARMMVSLPNYDYWAPKAGTTTQTAKHFDIHPEKLSVGCASSLRPGVLDVVERVQVIDQPSGPLTAEAGMGTPASPLTGDRGTLTFGASPTGGEPETPPKLASPARATNEQRCLSVVTEWRGFALHTAGARGGGAGGDGTGDVEAHHFIERSTQLVYPPAVFESIVKQLGWGLVALYASPSGRRFDADQSVQESHRTYLLQRQAAKDIQVV